MLASVLLEFNDRLIERLTFRSAGVPCSGWHFRGRSGAVDGPGGRPIVIMGHGFGGTIEAGLQPFAERISAAVIAMTRRISLARGGGAKYLPLVGRPGGPGALATTSTGLEQTAY